MTSFLLCETTAVDAPFWPDHAGASKRAIAQSAALINNLHTAWKRCQEAGLALLHAANYDGPDYDPTLMAAQMGED